MATLEEKAISFTEKVLAPTGWQGDKHIK